MNQMKSRKVLFTDPLYPTMIGCDEEILQYDDDLSNEKVMLQTDQELFKYTIEDFQKKVKALEDDGWMLETPPPQCHNPHTL